MVLLLQETQIALLVCPQHEDPGGRGAAEHGGSAFLAGWPDRSGCPHDLIDAQIDGNFNLIRWRS